MKEKLSYRWEAPDPNDRAGYWRYVEQPSNRVVATIASVGWSWLVSYWLRDHQGVWGMRQQAMFADLISAKHWTEEGYEPDLEFGL